MSVSVVIPYRDTGRGHERHDHLSWILARLRDHFPEWEIVVCSDGRLGDEPWSAATARVRGVQRTNGEVIVLMDADTWVSPENLAQAAEYVASGEHPWVMTHQLILRLSAAQSRLYKATGRVDAFEEWNAPRVLCLMETDSRGRAMAPYRQFAGGVPTVITRELFEACPPDVRFDGWGCEDNAWGWALETLHEGCWRLAGQAFHFYHEPDPWRLLRTDNPNYRGHEYETHTTLARRYLEAKDNVEAMRAIVQEHAGVTTP